MCGHNLDLRVPSMIRSVQQTHDLLRRKSGVLYNGLVDRQKLVTDRQSATPIRDARRQDVPHVHPCRKDLVQLLQGVRLQRVRIQVVAQDQSQFLTQRTLDLDEQRSQRVFHALHHRHVVLDGQVAQAGQMALTLEDLLRLRQ